MMITAVKGMNDVRPGAADTFLDSQIWTQLFRTANEVFESFGYGPVWLPLLEDTALFARGIGTETDIVSKEMYSLTDRGGRSLTLRPEGTAGAVRAYIEHHLGRNDAVQKWAYTGPMFRAERPQKGRYRQFYQIGAEFFGVAEPAADAELLRMLHMLCQRLGLPDVAVRLNSLGDHDSRMQYRATLGAFLATHADALCASCQARAQANPLRVLDCKRPSCQAIVATAPDILHALTPAARDWFDRLQGLLADANIAYTRDPHLVRGLDYYTGAIFEFTTGALGAQDAILGGGRYDGLVEALGGPATPAVGFAAGVERLALLLAQHPPAARGPHLFLVPLDTAATGRALALADAVRALGPWRIEVELSGARAKPAMRRANKLQAQHVMVLGSDELASSQARMKNFRSGDETSVALDAPALAAALAAAPRAIA
jgi:histidyl-tRNA synthetase